MQILQLYMLFHRRQISDWLCRAIYAELGNIPPETAFGLPSSFGKLDIDRQLDVFRERALETFGVSEVSEFGAEALKSNIIDRFLLKDQLKQGQSLSAQNIALQLLGA